MAEIISTNIDDYIEIKASGEIDASSSIGLDNALNKAIDESKKILVDLTDLKYISSAGLGVFVSYLEDLKTKSVNMILWGLRVEVLEVFNILGLQNLMTIKPTKEEALGALE